FPAFGNVKCSTLTHEKVSNNRVVDMALILLLAWVVHAVEEVVGVQVWCLGPIRHRIELTEVAGSDESPIFLGVELGFDAHVLEVLEDELGGVDEGGRAVGGEAKRGRKTLRMGGGGQQAARFGRVIVEIVSAVTQLRRRYRPVLQRGREGRIEYTDAFQHGID